LETLKFSVVTLSVIDGTIPLFNIGKNLQEIFFFRSSANAQAIRVKKLVKYGVKEKFFFKEKTWRKIEVL
jgi:hypothetical protein